MSEPTMLVSELLLMKERDELRAAVERLTKERDEARGLVRQVRGLVDEHKWPYVPQLCREAVRRWDAEQ